ncbi:hypothetical protein [Dactylosporangium sp. NPDC051541]
MDDFAEFVAARSRLRWASLSQAVPAELPAGPFARDLNSIG